MAQLRCVSLSNHYNLPGNFHFNKQPPRFPPISPPSLSSNPPKLSRSVLHTKASTRDFAGKIELSDAGGNGNNKGNNHGTGGNDENNEDSNNPSSSSSKSIFGILGLFIKGWQSRVQADPQFPFKVLMEEIVGVTSSSLGDMASRPNFGLNELDFVFSGLIVCSIVNFVLMYLLAPTSYSSPLKLSSSIFASFPKSHMFEPGNYSVFDRFGTFLYKGASFAVVGFAAGLVGTAISNGLIMMRKKIDPKFETQNKAPPMVLNALTWAIQLGFSSNLRYQSLNGIEFLLAKGLSPLGFKVSVMVLRCLNNVIGGVTFVALARLTGSQKIEKAKGVTEERS